MLGNGRWETMRELSSQQLKMSPQPNLHCHEGEEIFLMDSPCSSSLRSASGGGTSTQHHQHQSSASSAAAAAAQHHRYYLPFGQNANELSMERRRLHRITLQAAQQQQEECRQRSALGLRTSATNEGPMETPKNGAKILGPIDVNIPINGSRLAPPYHQNHSATRIGRMHRHQSAESTQSGSQLLIGTRKRRAEESEERLNTKERVWVCADVDRAIHLDQRCLNNLLEAEKQVQVSEAQIERQQQGGGGTAAAGAAPEQGVDGVARSRLVQWLQEVCEEEHADFVVLPLAVAYLDRVLATKFVPRRNLQALGSACLLLASKMKAPQPMMAGRLADLTDGMVKAEELLDWEMIVVNQLQWNLLQSTPFEFFDQLLVRSPLLEAVREDFALCMHRMLKDLSLATQLPSVQAAACLLFCALRSRRQHLLEESEQTIRRHFGLDPVNLLVPLLGNVAIALGGNSCNVAIDVQKLTSWTERQRAIQPPISKRMSLENTAALALSNSIVVFGQQSTERKHSAIGEERVMSDPEKGPTAALSRPVDPGPPARDGGSSPSQQQVDDESSRSSSNSSNESTKAKVANDSGYRSSETISPLFDRKAKDFGPLF